MKRTDEHRPGAIIPANYDALQCYSLPAMDGGWPVPAIGVDCTHEAATRDKHGSVLTYREHTSDVCCVERRETHAAAQGVAIVGFRGKCGVCGAHFTYGELWRHGPTGALVHLGHDCADKYNMLMDRSAWELENGRVRAAEARACNVAKNADERRAFLDAHPGLEDALKCDHHIIADIASRFVQWRSISEKQVGLVFKLADEIRNPKPARSEELHVDAPTGKGIMFEGEIVSTKTVENDYGLTTKMLVKVTTEAGCWLAYGTIPSSLYSDPTYVAGGFKGRRVEVKATLELPRGYTPEQGYETEAAEKLAAKRAGERHFVFMSRPSASFSDVAGCALPPPPKVPRAKKLWIVDNQQGQYLTGAGEWTDDKNQAQRYSKLKAAKLAAETTNVWPPAQYREDDAEKPAEVAGVVESKSDDQIP